MKKIGPVVVTLVCLPLFVAFDSQSGDSIPVSTRIISPEKVLETLEYIAKAYETNAYDMGSLRVQGRIFHEQRAKEGAEIPESNTFSPRWLNFKYIQKDGKRRYEQDRLSMPNERHYALDNNKRLLTFATNVVHIHPVSDEESRWVRLMHLYGRFIQVHPRNGCENIARATRTLIEDIRSGKFDRKDWNISIDVNDKGLFIIHLKRNIVTEEYTVDSHRGFNLVKAEYLDPSKKLWREIHGGYDYTQLENGQWVLMKATIKGISGSIVSERRLETTGIEVDFEAPDEVFEAESLNIPANIYTVDHHFSPPLKLNRGRSLDTDDIDALLELDIAKTEVANVDDKGHITVNTHQAYVEHETRNAKKPVETPIATSSDQRYGFIIIFSLIITSGGVVSVLVYLRSKRQVQQ